MEIVQAGWQPIAHDLFHLRLRERAARLLVRQHLLQRHDLARQLGDVLLGSLVDHRQPLANACDAGRRLGGAGGQRFAQALVERLEAAPPACVCSCRLRLDCLLEPLGDSALCGDDRIQPGIERYLRRWLRTAQREGHDQGRDDQSDAEENEGQIPRSPPLMIAITQYNRRAR